MRRTAFQVRTGRAGGRGAAAALLLCLGCLHAYAQDDWNEYRSRSFRIVGDADPDDAERVVARLEAFMAATRQFLGVAGWPSLPPATLVLLDGRGALRAAGIDPEDFFVFVGPDRTFVVLAEPGQEATLEGLLHRYFMEIARRAVPNAPLWIREGLAAFYRTTAWSEDGRRIDAGRPIESYMRRVRDSANRIGFARLAEAGADDEPAGRDSVLTAESWARVHYLMTRDGGSGQGRTAELVRLAASGRPFEAAVEDAFGAGPDEVFDGFESYAGTDGPWPRIALDADPRTREMTSVGEFAEIDALTVLGAVMVAGRLPGAEAQLGRALALDRNAPGPYIALAPLLIEQGRFDEVRYAVDQAGRREDPGRLGHYYYALSLLLEDPTPARGRMARARRELRAAIDLDPSFAEAYHRLAASFLGTGEPAGDALRALETAIELSPGNPEYLATYSRFLIAQERFDEARDVLAPLIDRMGRSRARDRAVGLMDSIAGRTGGRGLIGEGFAEIRTGDGNAPGGDAAPSAAPVQARRSPAADLERVVAGERQSGRLTLVDCRQGLALTVEDEAGTYVFHTDLPDRVAFSSDSAEEIGREIRCGVQDPPVAVVVTFQPAGEGDPFTGVPSVVEFVGP